MGQQQCACPYPTGRGRRFTSGVPAPHYDYIEPIAHPLLSAIEIASQPCFKVISFKVIGVSSLVMRAYGGSRRSVLDVENWGSHG